MAGSLLRRRDVRLIVSAVGVSSAGDFLLWVPLTLHLRAMHGSGLVVAGLFLALWTPIVVLRRPPACSSTGSRRAPSWSWRPLRRRRFRFARALPGADRGNPRAGGAPRHRLRGRATGRVRARPARRRGGSARPGERNGGDGSLRRLRRRAADRRDARGGRRLEVAMIVNAATFLVVGLGGRGRPLSALRALPRSRAAVGRAWTARSTSYRTECWPW